MMEQVDGDDGVGNDPEEDREHREVSVDGLEQEVKKGDDREAAEPC